MTDVISFIAACDTYAAAKGWLGRSRLSTLLFNDGKNIDRIANGGDIGARRLERVSATLAEWIAALPPPADEDWHRPALTGACRVGDDVGEAA